MTFSAAALIGFFLECALGVGCALAVLYSIYMGGYRAALRDTGWRLRRSGCVQRWLG